MQISKKRLAIATIILLIQTSWSLTAAYTVRGTVKANNGEEVSFATVSLMTTDSTLKGGAVAEMDGTWEIKDIATGDYILSASFMGYAKQYKNIRIDKNIDGVEFMLEEESQELSEISVIGHKKLVERQIDRIVLNVSESPLAAGSNGSDLLKKAPGVNVDKDGNVTVNGRSVEVYINGKPSYLSGDQLKGLLDGTSGTSIEKIEIITNPSSKYDAAGQGGVIDIKLKRNASAGLNGSVSLQYGGMYFKSIGKYMNDDHISLNLNYRGKNTYTAINLFQAYGQYAMALESETKQKVGGKEMHIQERNQSLNNSWQYYMLRVSNDWMIDDKNTLGFIVQTPLIVNSSKTNPGEMTSMTTIGSDTVERVGTLQDNRTMMPQHSINLNYTHTFRPELMQEITVNLDYNRSSSKSAQRMLFQYEDGREDLDVSITPWQAVNIYSAKIDFQTLFWKTAMLECGAKWAMTTTNNTMDRDTSGVGSEHTAFKYREQIAALYISAGKQFNEHWTAKLGLRGEMTHAVGDWITLDTVTGGKPYFNLFPTAYVGYAPTQDWNMSLSYTRRIGRPSYHMLNPFVQYQSTHMLNRGNPDLQPDFAHMVQMSFGYSQYVTLTFDFGTVNGLKSVIGQPMDNGDVMYTYGNFGSSTSHSILLNLTEVPIVRNKEKGINWLTLTANLSARHQINRSQEYLSKTWSGTVYGSLTLYLPEDIQMAADVYWGSPSESGFYKTSMGVYTGFSFKKQFLQKSLALTLHVSDILRSMNYDSEYLGHDDLVYKNKGEFFQQRVSIGLTYNFGKAEYHKYRKVGNVEESSRVGGSTGGNGGGGIGGM